MVYDDLVGKALCFGLVDSIMKKLGDEMFTRKFNPAKAKADAPWQIGKESKR